MACCFSLIFLTLNTGRNCRFLQGHLTNDLDVKKIKNAIKNKTDLSACLLNYKKDGTTFINQFYMSPLYDIDGNIAYYLGVQSSVNKIAEKQDG